MLKTVAIIEFGSIGKELRDWVLDSFNSKLCIKIHTTNIVLNNPTCEVNGVPINNPDKLESTPPHKRAVVFRRAKRFDKSYYVIFVNLKSLSN